MADPTILEKVESLIKKLDLDHLNLPHYLKLLLAYTGFDNELSISMMEESDINSIEEFARSDLPTLLPSIESKRSFYGMYQNFTWKFKIREGHKKLLQIVIDRCKKEKELQMVEATKRKLPEEAAGPNKRLAPSGSSFQRGVIHLNEEWSQAKEHIKKSVMSRFIALLQTVKGEERRNESLVKLNNLIVSVMWDKNIVMIKCPLCDDHWKGHIEIRSGKANLDYSNFSKHFKIHLNDMNAIKVECITPIIV